MLSILDEKCDVSIQDLWNELQSPPLCQLLPLRECQILVLTSFSAKAARAFVLALGSLRLRTLGLKGRLPWIFAPKRPVLLLRIPLAVRTPILPQVGNRRLV